MSKEIKKEYTNGELTIVWQPAKCIHAGECVKALPEVYKPNEKPWINADNASTDALKAQIAKCPSGALSYYMNDEGPAAMTSETEVIEVSTIPNGPLMVKGTCEVTDNDGRKTIKENMTAFCRCGHSANKPFCDGAHKKAGFEG